MTERSVQIWFQNRRAKIKLIAKKSIETGEDCDAVPESMRQYLAQQAFDSGKPGPGDFDGPGGTYGSSLSMSNDGTQMGKIVIHHLTCKSLNIGSWRRIGQNAMDLVVFYAPDKASLTYYINNEGAGYKIEYPFSAIRNISLSNEETFDDTTGVPTGPRGIVVELSHGPKFFMDSAGTGGFHQCGDFTEGQQASRIFVHSLGGHSHVLANQLAKLVSLESFKNRHLSLPQGQQVVVTPAPMSPAPPPRPSSQPNHIVHPHLTMLPNRGLDVRQIARGHKRQRSRSVPAALDFANMPPMPSFHVQRPSIHTVDDNGIYAPTPQHGNNHLGTFGSNNLRIDTSHPYGLDYRQRPMSTTTSNTSDFPSPSFLSTAVESTPATGLQPPYNLPFLSSLIDHSSAIQPSVSPLSVYSHADPAIASGSPMPEGIHRSPSVVDYHIYNGSNTDHSAITDEGVFLSEMYSKHNLDLPMHPTAYTAVSNTDLKFPAHNPSSCEDLDMNSMLNFSHLNGNTLDVDGAHANS